LTITHHQNHATRLAQAGQWEALLQGALKRIHVIQQDLQHGDAEMVRIDRELEDAQTAWPNEEDVNRN
jgi:hypothetical protein